MRSDHSFLHCRAQLDRWPQLRQGHRGLGSHSEAHLGEHVQEGVSCSEVLQNLAHVPALRRYIDVKWLLLRVWSWRWPCHLDLSLLVAKWGSLLFLGDMA